MAIVNTSGSQTATLGTEHTLATVTNAGRLTLAVDTANLVDGENVELRIYGKARTGDTERLIASFGYEHAQGADLKILGPFDSAHHMKLTLEQNGGTGRAFPWAVYQAE